MRKMIGFLSIFVMVFGTTLSAADNPYLNYQNYNHGYCPECNNAPCSCAQPCSPNSCQTYCDPCDPCAPVCGTECGISLCAIGVGVVAVAAAVAIVIAASNGNDSSSHSHS